MGTVRLTDEHVREIADVLWKNHLLRVASHEIRIIAGPGMWSTGNRAADRDLHATVKRLTAAA